MEYPPLPPELQLAAKTAQQDQDSATTTQSFPYPLPSHPLTMQQPPHPATERNTSPSASAAPDLAKESKPQPISDAVHEAFVQSPVAQNQLDPELVRQVTEQVIRNLMQNSNISSASNNSANVARLSPASQAQTQRPPPPAVHSAPQSPTQTSPGSTSRQYTPPSPTRKQNDYVPDIMPSPLSSESVQWCHKPGFSEKERKDSSRERKDPAIRENEHFNDLEKSTTVSSQRMSVGSDGGPPRRRGSGPESHKGKTPQSHAPASERKFSNSSVDSNPIDSQSRFRQNSDTTEATTLEKIWKPLFENGNPTPRLSQFLRGLALHLIDDYEPKCNLVVTPDKMFRFFNEVRVQDEHYPWDTIFGGAMTNASLSLMYRKLLCQHHLLQNQTHEIPSVAGLTPQGFERFMTCLIQAHPDTEFERLARAVMNMPISNADDKTERFPKELSRRLLPSKPNLHAEQRLVSSLNHEPRLVLRGASNMPPPPPPPGPAPVAQNSFPERERKPYSQSYYGIDDDDLMPSSNAIERERKPYIVKDGSGMSYGADERSEIRSNVSAGSKTRPSRTDSIPPPPSGYSVSAPSDPMNIPPPNNKQRPSAGVLPSYPPSYPPPSMGTYSRNGRRSPPLRNPYTTSDSSDFTNSSAFEQQPNNRHASQTPNTSRDQVTGGDADDDLGRRYIRRPTDPRSDDESTSRAYPIPPRPPPSAQGFDPTHNSGLPPVGGFGGPLGGPRDKVASGNSDDRYESRRGEGRRSTWYGTQGAGGSDGYGSFANNNGPPDQNYGQPVPY
ncbi:Hypothetical protein R9X50_00619200 [Acrodontium crateriforme]|uniref:DUF7514 domain-containing protein n=1 Tax=Acrodontium crateriforme TaxID=150365 RepID=A0AAQ3RC13_9PEZI|nr:Hypothetical protein R9X50_00619200 [Acrodontium crateriforme]